MKKPAIELLNVLRFFAITCIIFAHLDSFTGIVFFQNYDEIFGYIGLVIFFFISGFLLHYNNKIESKKDVIKSIKKRAIRIYPLFWMSILTTVILDISHLNILPSNLNIVDLIVDALGLQGLLPMYKTPYALWFIGVILIYYIIGYFLIYYARDLKRVAIYSVTIFILLFVIKYEFGFVHTNIFYYYFVFFGGYATSFRCNSNGIDNKSIKSIIVTSLFFTAIPLKMWNLFCSMMSERGITANYINENGISTTLATETFRVVLITYTFIFVAVIIAAIIAGFVTYRTAFHIPDKHLSNKIFSNAAYSSYAVYLFHITILSLLKNVLGTILKEGVLIDYLMLILGIPLLFVIGYQIQKRV